MPPKGRKSAANAAVEAEEVAPSPAKKSRKSEAAEVLGDVKVEVHRKKGSGGVRLNAGRPSKAGARRHLRQEVNGSIKGLRKDFESKSQALRAELSTMVAALVKESQGKLEARMGQENREIAELRQVKLKQSCDANSKEVKQLAQTCEHLQGGIRDVEAKLLETQRGLAHTVESVDTLKGKKDGNEDAVHSLQTGLSDTNIALAKLQSEVDRNVKATRALVISDQSNKDKIVQLDEGRKMIDTRLDVMMNDITQHRDANKRLQDDITNSMNEEKGRLNKILENVILSLDQMSKEQKQIVENQKDSRNQVREADLDHSQAKISNRASADEVTHLLDRVLQPCTDPLQRSLAHYLLELSLMDMRVLKLYSPTIVADSAVVCSYRLLHGLPAGGVGSCAPCAKEMFRLLFDVPNGPLQAVRKKYSQPVFHGIAKMDFASLLGSRLFERS